MSEDAHHDTVRRARVLASTTARTVAGEEDVRRVRVGVRERMRKGGRGGGTVEREETPERKREGGRKQAATMSGGSSRRPDAHRLSGVPLEQERCSREGELGGWGVTAAGGWREERRTFQTALDISYQSRRGCF